MFIPPMLCTSLRDPNRLGDPRYVAEPKFDGQRAQIHVAGGRPVVAFSRSGRSLLAHAGPAWLRDVRWLLAQMVLDAEVCGATGSDGIRAVLEARRGSTPSPKMYDLAARLRHRAAIGGAAGELAERRNVLKREAPAASPLRCSAHCGRRRLGDMPGGGTRGQHTAGADRPDRVPAASSGGCLAWASAG